MKSTPKAKGMLLLFGLSVAVLPGPSQGTGGNTLKQLVNANGCVTAGVEAGCLVLSDFRTKSTYNLFFEGEKADIDMAISFEGTKHQGPTTCMQGVPVDVSKWTQLKTKCQLPKDSRAEETR